MAKQDGQVTLRGRFPAGSRVTLVEVKDESVLRPEGGKDVETARVGDDGSVQFSKGVKVDGRYFVVGRVGGFPVEVRARGRAKGDEAEVLSQPPVAPDRVKLADGSFLDESPEKVDEPVEGAPHLSMQQVPEGAPLRSSTARGSAHPVEPGERVPTASQGDVDDDAPQMSSTAEGEAARIVGGPKSQEDAGDIPQRSSTEKGVATPVPQNGAVRAQLDKESPLGRESRGGPQGAAAAPLSAESAGGEELKGEALRERARELDIEGRGSMSADELRAAVAAADTSKEKK